jgi:tRNA(Ile)-lysidine synthase
MIEGRALVLAISGGLDSTALAVILKLLAPRLGMSLSAAHLDHGLRPESGEDAAFCAAFCAEMGIPFVSVARDVRTLSGAWNTGIEDAGRKARHAWLEETRERFGAFAVVMAHHLDDLAEDQLMRLTRRAGWPALGGMKAWDPARRILRPLLMTPKGDLRRLLTELDVAWREDATNADPAFTRNRVRRDILPLFVRENPDYLGACAELWRQARLDEIHWNDALSAALVTDRADGGQDGSGIVSSNSHASRDESFFLPDASRTSLSWPEFLSNESLDACSQALRLRLYKRTVEALGPGQALSAALHGLDEAWRNRSTGKRFQFPGGKEARVERGGISFQPGPMPLSVDTSKAER